MQVTLEPAYEQPEVMRAMIQEYVDALVMTAPPFASCFQERHCEAELANLRQRYGKPDGRLYLARVDGAPAGCAALRRLNDRTCELKRLYVRPRYRRRGVGRKLAERLTADAREIGYRYMELDTLPMLPEAMRLFRSMGFYEIPAGREAAMPQSIFMQLLL